MGPGSLRAYFWAQIPGQIYDIPWLKGLGIPDPSRSRRANRHLHTIHPRVLQHYDLPDLKKLQAGGK